jgi:hypothetical protein
MLEKYGRRLEKSKTGDQNLSIETLLRKTIEAGARGLSLPLVDAEQVRKAMNAALEDVMKEQKTSSKGDSVSKQ